MNVEDAKKIAGKLLRLTDDELEKYSIKIDNVDAIYCSIPIKGGCSLIVGFDGTVLYGNSSVGYTWLIDEYLKGRRTPIEEFDNFKRIE